ncbi:type I restriction enzyme HsdR N-terminal domain-containing protein [Rugosibacter aromaticivorans]|uniref:type I restriction enzyme HsdR N-terminal domain-containing protein n=1 Tax=Rugosibacter aromaticivorans TaxID=1565605 RepID=UPI000B17342D|nr:type I restriction enzyme HsdR N-terminal domain-containing protein [Rugosibacter aromaticivorans]
MEASITLKDSGKKPAPYIHCLVRGKPIKLTPEEAVRQLYIMVLKDDLGYPVSRMELEYGVTFGRENWMWWMKHSSTSSTKAARARKGSISRRAM